MPKRNKSVLSEIFDFGSWQDWFNTVHTTYKMAGIAGFVVICSIGVKIANTYYVDPNSIVDALAAQNRSTLNLYHNPNHIFEYLVKNGMVCFADVPDGIEQGYDYLDLPATCISKYTPDYGGLAKVENISMAVDIGDPPDGAGSVMILTDFSGNNFKAGSHTEYSRYPIVAQKDNPQVAYINVNAAKTYIASYTDFYMTAY